jgi:integrase
MSTRKAYRQHWARFEEWCRDHDMIPLPASPITVASFIAHLAETGPIFRAVDCHGRVSPGALTGRSVARIIKRLVQAGGYDPRTFSGHSLRAGLATAAAAAGKSERAIMGTTGHRSERMVRRYVREGSLFRDNAANGLL